METCDPIYRPTNFWVPGMRQLSANLHARELDSFKSWPGASLVLSGIRRRFLQRNHQGNVWVRGDGQPQGERVLAQQLAERLTRGAARLRCGPAVLGPVPLAL